MEYSISPLTSENPHYIPFLEAARVHYQWKHVFFLESIDGWLKAFGRHAMPFLLTTKEMYLPLLQARGHFFFSLSDFLYGDGPCPEQSPLVLPHLDSFSFCFPLSFPSSHKQIPQREYFLIKQDMMTFPSYLSSLGAGWRKELRRRKNKWKDLSCVQIDSSHFLEGLPQFFLLHRKRFGPSFYNSKELLVYVYYLIKTQPQSILVFELKQEESLGHIVWIKMGHRLNLFTLLSNAPEERNAGKALVYFSLEKLFSLPGSYEINFDTGYGHYKEHWAKQTRDYVLYIPTQSQP